MRHRTTLVLGLVWGLAWLLLSGGSPGSRFDGLSGDSVRFATLELVAVDNLIFPLKVVLLPEALGLDLAVWTVGFLLWPFSGQVWPGAALAAALSGHPFLASVVVIVFSGLGGVGLALGLLRVVEWFRHMPSRS